MHNMNNNWWYSSHWRDYPRHVEMLRILDENATISSKNSITWIRNAVRSFARNAIREPGHIQVHIFSPARLYNWHAKQHGQKKAQQPRQMTKKWMKQMVEQVHWNNIASYLYNRSTDLSTKDARSPKHLESAMSHKYFWRGKK